MNGGKVAGPIMLAVVNDQESCSEMRGGVCLNGRRCPYQEKHSLKWAVMTPNSARVLMCPHSLVGVSNCPNRLKGYCTLAHFEDRWLKGVKYSSWKACSKCTDVVNGWCMNGLACQNHDRYENLVDIEPPSQYRSAESHLTTGNIPDRDVEVEAHRSLSPTKTPSPTIPKSFKLMVNTSSGDFTIDQVSDTNSPSSPVRFALIPNFGNKSPIFISSKHIAGLRKEIEQIINKVDVSDLEVGCSQLSITI